MLRAEAIRRLKKLYGKKAYWQVRDVISSPENRKAAGDKCRELKAKQDEISAQMDEVRKRLLDDPEYKALCAAHKEIRLQREALTGQQLTYRFEAGYISGVGGLNWAHVEGQGDTWEDVFREIEKKRVKAS